MAHIGEEGRFGAAGRVGLLLGQHELRVQLLQVHALAGQLRGGLDQRFVLDRKVFIGAPEVGGARIHLDLVAHPVRNLPHDHGGHGPRKQHGSAAEAQDDEREPGRVRQELILAEPCDEGSQGDDSRDDDDHEGAIEHDPAAQAAACFLDHAMTGGAARPRAAGSITAQAGVESGALGSSQRHILPRIENELTVERCGLGSSSAITARGVS